MIELLLIMFIEIDGVYDQWDLIVVQSEYDAPKIVRQSGCGLSWVGCTIGIFKTIYVIDGTDGYVLWHEILHAKKYLHSQMHEMGFCEIYRGDKCYG